MRVDLFDFDLPESAIAHHPVEPRDAARLLHVKRGGSFADASVRDLPSLLQPGDIMVVNNTRVIPARLRGKRGDASVELLLHQQVEPLTWWGFAKPARKLRVGDRLVLADDFAAEVVEIGEEGLRKLRFLCDGAESFWILLHREGDVPLPPYIKREQGKAEARDVDDYQTIYAEHQGAVAAPTAGLHFTDRLFAALDARSVERVQLTLHVGAGTFLPVKADDTDDHQMHTEVGVLTADTADKLNAVRACGGRIVAVGTTSMRLLESATDENGVVHPFEGETDIFITPGYRFKVVDVLMTNFHLPRSTLFMLVSAFSGLEVMQRAYAHAIDSGYRFYSYGDGCLLERAPT